MPWAGGAAASGLEAGRTAATCSATRGKRTTPVSESGGTGAAVGASMVRLAVSLDAASLRSAQELLDAFRFLIPATKLEPGCLGCNAWKARSATVHYTEEWTN